jgi:MtN3 and saliva related transmembrane protein
MNAGWVEALGYGAAVLTTVSFVPQVWHTWRTRDVGGISLGMYTVFATGVSLWLAYGAFTRAWPIVAANAVTLALALCILAMKLRWRDRAAPQPLTSVRESA